MAVFSILCGAALYVAAPVAAAVPVQWPRNALVMFVAEWCAPCIDEMRRVNELERAAAPRRLVVVSLDQQPQLLVIRRQLERQDDRISAAAGWKLLGALADGDAAGLPVSVMVNEHGRICATHAAAVTAADVAAMLTSCEEQAAE